ncbi:hypothetical protein SB861_37680 [Paraburkholderia sp. SIMBA_049]
MSLFGNLKSDGLEESQDRLGGNFGAVETDIYSGIIKALYAGQSTQGARNVTLIADFGGREFRETIYITNRAGENWYPAKDKEGKPTGKKAPLPGFTMVDDICLIATGKPLAEQEAEDKVVKVYDPEAGKELPKSVPMIVEAIGKPISLAIQKVLENKSTKEGDVYVPTAETREVNSIEKAFDTDTKMTVNEAKAGAETPAFWDAWLQKNKGKTRDKRTLKEGEAGAAGAPPKARSAGSATPPAANQAAPRKSLFGKQAA